MVKLTPPMGWNSWNTFGANINEELIKETADVMQRADCWQRGMNIWSSTTAGP